MQMFCRTVRWRRQTYNMQTPSPRVNGHEVLQVCEGAVCAKVYWGRVHRRLTKGSGGTGDAGNKNETEEAVRIKGGRDRK